MLTPHNPEYFTLDDLYPPAEKDTPSKPEVNHHRTVDEVNRDLDFLCSKVQEFLNKKRASIVIKNEARRQEKLRLTPPLSKMMADNLTVPISEDIHKTIKTGRLYQTLDNIVYDFGAFHTFYALRNLFNDMDNGEAPHQTRD